MRLAECQNASCDFCQLSVKRGNKRYCDALIETNKQGEKCKFFKLRKGEKHEEAGRV